MIITMVNIPLAANADVISATNGISATIKDFKAMTSLGSEYSVTSNGHLTVGLGDDGLEFYQAKSTLLKADGTRNGNMDGYFYSDLSAQLENDTANRTTLSTTQLKGNFDLVVNYLANVDRYEKHPETGISLQGYFTFNVGNNTTGTLPFKKLNSAALFMRVDHNNLTTLNHNSMASSTMSKSSISTDHLNGVEHNLRITYDTEEQTQTVVLDGDTANASTGKFFNQCDYINAIYICGMERMNEGAYFKIKDIKLENYTFDSETQAIVNVLPEKLADNVNEVKENITVPVINGVTWTSSNPEIISETGVVTQGDVDADVTLTATFGSYTKTYTMTVPKYVEPSIPEVPLPENVVYELDFTKLTSLEGTGWKVSGDDYVDASLTADGLKLLQVDSKIFNEEGTRNGAAAGKLTGGLVFELSRDTANRTVTTVKELRGSFDVIVDYKANVDRYQTHPENGKKVEGYYAFNVGTATKPTDFSALKNTIFIGRFDQKNITTLNNSSMSLSTLTPNTLKADNLSGAEHSIKFSYNTSEKTQKVMIDNNPELVSSGAFGADVDYVNAIYVSGLQRMNVGSYLAFKKIQIANYAPDATTQSIIDNLPAKLADNVNGVTENITLPNINGVIWKSSNTNIIADDGTVTRGSKDIDVTVTASVGGIEKSYTMTVLKKESQGGESDTPVLPPVEEGNKLIYDMSEYTTYGEASGEWFITNSGTNDIYVENGSLIIKDRVGGDGNTPDGALNSAFAVNAGITFEGIMDKDDVNNTEITSNTFAGKYALEFTYKTNMTTDRHAAGDPTKLNNTYYFITFGYRDPGSKNPALTDEYADFRVPGTARAIGAAPTDSTPYFYHANASGSKVSYTTKSVVHENEVTFRFVFDTVDMNIDSYILDGGTGEFVLCKEDIPYIAGKGTSGIFNGMLIKCLEAYNEGSYIEIKDLKMYEVLPDVYDMRYLNGISSIGKMPEKLVDDTSNVTSDIENIPSEVEETKVSWISGNTMVLTKEGKVTNWVDASNTYLAGSMSFTDPDDASKPALVFSKKYKMTIPAIEGASSKLVYEGTYDNNWKFGYNYSEKTATHEFTENSLKLEQITPDDPAAYSNMKNYYGILHFNGVEVPYDEATRAEVYSDTFSGIYDLEFDLKTAITSAERPVTVDLGFYDTVNEKFNILGSMESYKGKTQLRTWETATKSVVTEFAGSLANTTNIRLRVDTNTEKMWVFIGETLVTDAQGISYYNPLGNKGYINAVRIAMDKNLELGDSAEISNIKLTQKMKNDVYEKVSLLSVAEYITVNDITNTPSAVSGSIKSLPLTVGSYSIKWSSLNPDMINVETGAVYGKEEETDVWVMAEIYNSSATNPVNVKKAFKLTVPVANANGIVQYRLNLLELSDYTKQSLNAIYYDIDLPSEDAFGSKLEWTSSNTSVIGNDGKLADTVNKETKVTLTAKLTANGVSGTKNFVINVMPKTELSEIYNGTGKSFTVDGIENVSIYGNSTVIVTTNTASGVVTVSDKDGNKVAEINLADYGKTTLSLVFIPEEGVYNVLDTQGNILDEGVPMLAECEEISSVNGATNVKVLADTFTVLNTAMQFVNYDVPYAVVEDQEFPTEFVMGATVTWTTDNTSVLANDGKLTVPEKYTFVTVTCTLTKDGSSVSKSYYLPVPCAQTKNVMLDKTVTANSSAEAGRSLKYVTDGNAETYGAVAYGSTGAYFEVALDAESYINTVYVAQPEENIKNYVVECFVDGKIWKTVATGSLEGKKFELVTFNNTLASKVRIRVESALKSPVSLSAFEGFLHTSANELMKLELSVLTLDAPYEITGDITLPATGKYGTPITWTSKNSDIITSTGKYTQPKKSTVVTLVASVPSGDTKEFKFFATGSNGGEGAKPSGSGGAGGGGGMLSGGGAIVAAPETNTNATTNSQPVVSVFADVPTDSWYYTYVKDLKEKGIVNGDDKGNFNPSLSVTREEFVKMLVIAAGVEETDGNINFADVSSDSWYYEYVKTAVSAGIVNGISANEFGAGTRISRQDMAVMIYRLLKANGKTYSVSYDKFADDANIADYAREAVYAMKEAGILIGSEGKYNPNDALTRAESAKVISVLNELMAE